WTLPPTAPTPPTRPRGERSSDRVRIGGSVQVTAGEIIDGDVVAIGGSADVNGEVNGDVVAIGGNMDLGPEANVDGDAVVVGGVLRRNPSARVRGEIQEIGFGGMGVPGGWRWPTGGMPGMFFGTMADRFFALVSTMARLAVLCFLVSLVLVFARGYAEQVGERAAEQPVKAGLVGLLIQLLFVPALCVTIVVMVVTIIGIPLLLLIPFALLAFVLLLLVGFSAVVYDVGRLITSRFGWESRNPYLIAAAGVVLVLSPVLLSRLVGFGGPFISPFAWTLLLFGLLVEYVAWTVGLGAVALLRFERRALTAPGNVIAS
ncbi:MAG TPA: polymer-forming cytoskeletal protein, partial [Vicinamibacterales bacterium]|nr:polymer-forming cytoskeletal protein [Vicinamibacterales bacterium]